MPKIEVNEKQFFELLGRRLNAEQLEYELTTAKAELDAWESQEGVPEDERVIKIELNDTNRPDLWSTAGVARQLRIHAGADIPEYNFFSREGDVKDSEYQVFVDSTVKEVRPYMAAFVISGKAMTNASLLDCIQTQEKLCANFGRKRKTVSMGIYRINLIKWPVTYKGADPDKNAFVPLQMEEKLTLRQIVEKHPKGIEYGHLISGSKLFPLLTGSDGGILSMAPIINSADIGAVKVGDTDLLVEFTGDNMESITLSASMVACDFADQGYTIKPVKIDYAYDTPYGKSITFPYYFQTPASTDSAKVTKLLGQSFDVNQITEALRSMGVHSEFHGQHVVAYQPEYRNDYLHAVDVVEDVMIGYGLDRFEPDTPKDFTVGRISACEMVTRKARDVMVGLGYQEMVYNYLGSGKDYIEKMNVSGENTIKISNPMTENFEYVRPSILPELLASEAISSKAVYPHKIFEAGKVVFKDDKENYGSQTRQRLGFLSSSPVADFNEMAATVSAMLYYLGLEYNVVDCDDSRFLPGRQAKIVCNGIDLGIFGEIHPIVLENWGISMPCVGGELDLESLIK